MGLREAQRDLEALEGEIAKLEDRLSDAKLKAVKIRHYIEIAQTYERESPPRRADATESARSGGSTTRAQIEASKEEIQKAGTRLKTARLLELLKKRGLTISGKDPLANLSATLSRSGEFDNDRSLGWGVKETASPDTEAHNSENEANAPCDATEGEADDPDLGPLYANRD